MCARPRERACIGDFVVTWLVGSHFCVRLVENACRILVAIAFKVDNEFASFSFSVLMALSKVTSALLWGLFICYNQPTHLN